jgi:hypothetical protein
VKYLYIQTRDKTSYSPKYLLFYILHLGIRFNFKYNNCIVNFKKQTIEAIRDFSLLGNLWNMKGEIDLTEFEIVVLKELKSLKEGQTSLEES